MQQLIKNLRYNVFCVINFVAALCHLPGCAYLIINCATTTEVNHKSVQTVVTMMCMQKQHMYTVHRT